MSVHNNGSVFVLITQCVELFVFWVALSMKHTRIVNDRASILVNLVCFGFTVLRKLAAFERPEILH